MRSIRFSRALAVLLLALAPAAPGRAATSDAGVYHLPPQVLVDIVDAPPTPPPTRLDPRREWVLLLEQPNLPPVADLAERELRLGGLRIRPRTSGPSRTSFASGLKLLRLSDLAERQIVGLPSPAQIGNVRWAPDGSRFAFTHTGPEGIELWVTEVGSGQARRLADARLNLAAGAEPQWLRDGRSLVCALVPADRGAEPAAPAVPAGPVMQESLGRTAPARTFQDLLKNPHDETLFEHYLTSQAVRIGLDGQVVRLGKPALFSKLMPSPDGKYLLAETLHRPFSYLVPYPRFPHRTEVWDLEGNVVRVVADVPLQEEIPISFDSAAAGPREIGWRNDAPATLFWVEALDGGDGSKEAAERDRILLLAAPFQGDPAPLATLGLRFSQMTWGATTPPSWKSPGGRPAAPGPGCSSLAPLRRRLPSCSSTATSRTATTIPAGR